MVEIVGIPAIIPRIMRSTVRLFRSPSAPIRYVSPIRPRVRTVHTALEWSSVWIQSRTFNPSPYSFGRTPVRMFVI